MADYVLGMNAKIYYGTAAAALASLTELTNVKDVTLNLSAGEADVTTRANSGWKATAPTLRECTVDFEMVWKPSDTGFAAMKTAFLAGTTVELAVLDGSKSVSGSQGPKGAFGVTKFTRTEPLGEAMTVSISAKMTSFTEWVSV
jgi:TP901-1 family phage major tail protein